MSYESLERELARRQSKRQSRRSKGDKKSKRKYSPYRRGGRKGSKTRTRLAEGEDKLGKALAAARERAAKYAKPRLNITKLPDREQLSLKDFDAETFNAESKDEAIVVEGYKPKRVETYMGTVVLFYVGEMAERRYGPMSVTYPERTLLLPPIPNSIVNPTGITVEDVDEIMQHYTGAPWTGEYVLFSEDTGHLVDSGRTRLYANFESEEFRAEPAMYVKCFECEKPGYSDEMSKIAFGHLCARCARPEINWDAYSAESGLNNTHRDILTYLSPFNPELVHRKYGIPAGLTQREIGNAIGTVRTNATKHLQDLIELGLVTQIMRRPDGERRKVKVYLPTYEGRKIAESFRAEDLNGNGVIDAWETHAHENTLTGLAHEETHFSETFRANLRKTNLKPSQIREKAQEAFEGVTGWMWLSELTGKINSTLSARQRIAPRVVSRAIGNTKGGHYGFYVTLDKRIFYYGDKDRGEFIKGVI